MRKAALAAAVLALVMAGCAEPPSQAAPPATLEPLPEPRYQELGANVGAAVVQDQAYAGATTGPLPWRAECLRQWSSGAYDYTSPPVVDGKPCLELPTPDGTLRWAVLRSDATLSVPAAALLRPDGGVDWVFFGKGDTLMLLPNGTRDPVVLVEHTGTRELDQQRVILSGAVMADGSRHVLIHDWTPAGAPGQSAMRFQHVWWAPQGEVAVEQVDGGFPFDTPRWRGSPAALVAVAPSTGGMSQLHITTGGALTTVASPLRILDADVDGETIWACAGGPGGYYLLQFDLGGGVVAPPELVAPSALAPLGFTCGLAITSNGVMVAIDSPAAFGGGPNPTGGTVAYTRTAPGLFTSRSVGFAYHSGAWTTSVGGVPYILSETANGTGTGNERDGTELRTPDDGDPTKPWRKVWGDFGRSTYLMEDEGRLMAMGQMWANSPFRFGHAGGDGRQTTWGLMEIPIPPADLTG